VRPFWTPHSLLTAGHQHSNGWNLSENPRLETC